MAKKKRPTFGKKIRVGFIGAGGIARHHMGLLDKFDDVKIVAASDPSEDALKQCSEQFKIKDTYTDYKEMLKEAKLDAVNVCTPNYLHAQPAIDALNLGLSVIVEKPMAMNAIEAQSMVDAAKKNDRLCVIGFQYRYGPESQTIKKYIDDGQFGKILYARCKALRRRGIPNWGVFTRKDLQGGGPMIDIGVHIIEVTHYLMGSPKPVSVLGNTYTYLGDDKETAENVACGWPNWDHENYTVEDLATGLVRFDNGATLSIEASFAGHLKDEWSSVLMGEKAGASLFPTEIYKDEAGTMVDVKPSMMPEVDGFEMKLRNWVDCVKSGEYEKSMAPGEHGVMVQQILDGVYQSAEAGKEIRFD
jgi:predicted dehydrogenase